MNKDNGEIKTEEQLLKEKKEAFDKDPDRFVDMKNIVFVTKRVPGGIAHWLGSGTRSQYNIAKSECQYQIDKVLREMEETKKPTILNPFKKNKGAFGKRF